MPMPEPIEITVPLPGGRQLTAAAYGDPDAAVTCLHHHGTGASRWEAEIFHDAAVAAGLRVVGVDRPGAGDSTPVRDRRLGDWPTDLLAVADHLGLDRFAVSGISGGGPHALAVAAAAPDRVSAVIAINSGPPAGDDEVIAPIPAKVRLGPRMARRTPRLFDLLMVPLLSSPALGRKAAEKQVPPEDLAVLAIPGVAERLERIGQEGRRNNPRFFAEALILWAADWPFDPYALQVPVVGVTGEADPFRAFTEKLVARNRDARLVVVPGGHLAPIAPDVAATVVDVIAAAIAATPPDQRS